MIQLVPSGIACREIGVHPDARVLVSGSAVARGIYSESADRLFYVSLALASRIE